MLEPEKSRRVVLQMIEDFEWESDREVTCEKCGDNDNCEFAFDPYNTDGDCLALK